MKVCREPGCPSLQAAPRCPEHAQAYEARRGSRQARGYDAEHDRLRAEWTPRVATGRVRCPRCGKLIASGSAWDLGHHDTDRRRYNGPEHSACNRSAGGRAAHH
jgi:hypothetical protein